MRRCGLDVSEAGGGMQQERASAAELVGFRRLAFITDGRAQTIRSPIAPDRPGQVEGSCAATTSVVGLVASSGGATEFEPVGGFARARPAPSLARERALFR